MAESGPLTATLAALSQATRLALLEALVRAGRSGMQVNGLVDVSGVAQGMVSSHLAVLQRAGLVTVEREGRTATYRADADAIEALLKELGKRLS